VGALTCASARPTGDRQGGKAPFWRQSGRPLWAQGV